MLYSAIVVPFVKKREIFVKINETFMVFARNYGFFAFLEGLTDLFLDIAKQGIYHLKFRLILPLLAFLCVMNQNKTRKRNKNIQFLICSNRFPIN